MRATPDRHRISDIVYPALVLVAVVAFLIATI